MASVSSPPSAFTPRTRRPTPRPAAPPPSEEPFRRLFPELHAPFAEPFRRSVLELQEPFGQPFRRSLLELQEHFFVEPFRGPSQERNNRSTSSLLMRAKRFRGCAVLSVHVVPPSPPYLATDTASTSSIFEGGEGRGPGWGGGAATGPAVPLRVGSAAVERVVL